MTEIAKSSNYRPGSNAITRFRFHLYLYAVLGIMCLSVVLSLLFLAEKSIDSDESVSIAIANSNWPTIWQTISQGETNMVGYYVLLHFWIYLGNSEFVIRSLSALFAVLTVPTVFALGTQLFSKRVGLIAALLATINPMFIQYAQDARSYSMVLLFATLSTLFLVIVVRRPSKLLWTAYAIASIIAVYAHVFACFILAAQAISLLFMRRQSIPWKGLLVSWMSIIILILPLVLLIFTRSGHNLDWVPQPGLTDLIGVFASLSGGKYLLAAFFVVCLWACIYAARQWLVYKASEKNWQYSLLIALLLVPIILAFGISMIRAIFEDKYLIVCIPALVILAAVGISLLPKRFFLPISLIVLVGLSGFQLRHWYIDYEKEDWRGTADYVLANSEKGDAIIFFMPLCSTAFNYYQNQTIMPDKFPVAVPYFDPGKYPNIDPILNLPLDDTEGRILAEADEALPARLAGYDKIWLVLSHDAILGRDIQRDILQNLLEKKYGTPESQAFKSIRVLVYNSR
jgi:mannosyltransferase